jgi:hypothetical protein
VNAELLVSVDSSIVAELLVRPQEALEHLRHGVFGHDDRLDEEVGHARDVVECDDVRRVEDADGQPISRTVDRDQTVLATDGARHQRDHVRIERHVGQVDEAMPGVQRDGFRHLRLGHQLRADQQML